MPHAGDAFLELFRRRFQTLPGEIRPLGEFSLISNRQDVGVELPRVMLFGRAMLIAAPRELLRRACAEPRSTPSWLEGSVAPTELPVRLFRADADALPVGLAQRAIISPGPPEALHWLARHRDPGKPRVEWLVISGPGAAQLASGNPLGDLNPFAGRGIVPVDPGPTPGWDRDGSDQRFGLPRPRAVLRQRPSVIAVGPEVAPDLGLEGEVLWARSTALKLVERLGGQRPLV